MKQTYTFGGYQLEKLKTSDVFTKFHILWESIG